MSFTKQWNTGIVKYIYYLTNKIFWSWYLKKRMWYDYQYDNCPLTWKLTLGHRRSTIWTITTKSIKKIAKVNICYRNNYSLEHNSSITQEVIIECLHLFDICMTVCSCSIVNKQKQKQTNKYYTKKRVGKSQNISCTL